MKIYALDLLSGKVPDPYYKNLFWFPDVCDPSSETPISAQTKIAIENLEGIAKTTISILSTQEPDKTVYAIAETPTVCSLSIARPEIRSISELSELAQYIIIHELKANGTTRTFSFWFVMNISILSEGKFRVDLQRDEWASNWSVYINTPIQFTRRHTRRWKRRTPGVDVFDPVLNGLSDPVAEAMVMSKTHDEPAPVFGSSRVNITGIGYCRPVMLWRYVRLSAKVFYYNDEGGNHMMARPRAIKMKETIPSVAFPLGIVFRPENSTKTYFRPFSYINDGSSNVSCNFYDSMNMSAYVAESFISSRPPCPFTWDFYTVGGNTFLRAKVVTGTGYPTITVYPSLYVHYGAIGEGNTLPGGGVYNVTTSEGNYNYSSFSDSFTITQNSESFPQTETKIFESPYSSKHLKIGTANIDISPAPGRAEITVDIPCMLGTSAVIKGDGDDIAEVAGWWSGMQDEMLTDALTEWLISNRNTYEQGKNWQFINTTVDVAKGVVTKNYAGAGLSLLSGIEQHAMNEARIKDLANAPGSASLPTGNGFDNLPFVDQPLLAITETIEESKQKIIRFWKRYGYPDNSTAAMKDSITRDEVVYMQGTPTVPTPGIIPPRQSWFNSAVSSGVYLWRIHNDGGTYTTTYGETLDPADIMNMDEV